MGPKEKNMYYEKKLATVVVSLVTPTGEGLWHGVCAQCLVKLQAFPNCRVRFATYSPKGTCHEKCNCY
jgi:hypothetical protein